jgi:hypothetical protein
MLDVSLPDRGIIMRKHWTLTIAFATVLTAFAFTAAADTEFQAPVNTSVRLDSESVTLQGNVNVGASFAPDQNGGVTAVISCRPDVHGIGQTTRRSYVLVGSDSNRIKAGGTAADIVKVMCRGGIASDVGIQRVRLQVEIRFNSQQEIVAAAIREIAKE